MKKVLFLAHQLEYPPVSGGAVKRWKMVEYLSKHYHLAVFMFFADNFDRRKAMWSAKIRTTAFYGEILSRPRTIRNLVKSYFAHMPLSLYRNYSATFKAHVEQTAAGYDILFLDSLIMAPYIPEGFGGRIILHAHNAEYAIWEKLARLERNPIKKWAILLESRRIKACETAAGNKAHGILAAPNDQLDLVRLGIRPEKFYETYHLGDDRLLDLPGMDFDRTQEALLHVGTLSWEPNADGLIWFINHVWDRLKITHPRLRFTIVGGKPSKTLQRLVQSKKDIILTGFVTDLTPYYDQCRVFVAPLRFGGGIKVKIINALYRGIPVVTTPAGTAGLALKDRVHAAISEDPHQMAGDIHTLLTDKPLWQAIQKNARRLAKETYTWDRVFAAVDRAVL